MRKVKRKSLIKDLDTELSRVVRQNRCVKCGSDFKQKNCSHFYGRALKSVRWDFDNVKCACVGCHFWFDAHPDEHTKFVKELLGQERYEALVARANKSRKWEIYELQDMLKELRLR